VAQVFRNFQLSVSLGQLRGIRIYVTGFTAKPGSYTVSSLSTVVHGVMKAGGPSAAGTFRNIQLRRGGKLVSTLDLYDLLIKGDRSGDRVLQPEDVIHIGPVGTQTAVIGSVNKPAIFELKKGETVDDVLQMAGGLTAVADQGRLSVERLDERIGARVSQLKLPEDLAQRPANGDVLRAFSAVEATLPMDKQNKRVRIEGEVARPGDYILPPSSSIIDAIRIAGGLTPNAYVFGTEFSRESVRQSQQENYERALRDLETEFARSTTTQRALTADDAQIQASRGTAASKLIERLRAIRPTGRIVLQLDPETAHLPELAVENGDRIYVPALPTTVGVFGSVFNGGSYLFSRERKVTDYVRLAGGTTRGADDGSAFVLRANGSVVSARQSGGFFSSGSLGEVPALPGDTVFVPEEMNKTTFMQAAKEWTQILYQFGLGAAALKTIRE
jgi:protein involved in polysaccharide export with SLBB domain